MRTKASRGHATNTVVTLLTDVGCIIKYLYSRKVALHKEAALTLQGRLLQLTAAGKKGSRAAQLLRLLLEADALQDTAATLGSLLRMTARGPGALFGASQAAAGLKPQGSMAPRPSSSEAQIPCSAHCSPQEAPPGCAGVLRGQEAQGRPIAVTRPWSAASARSQVCCSRALSTGSCSALQGAGSGGRWHVASDTASGHGFMAPANPEGPAALRCVVAPAATGLAVATRSVREELEAGALTPEARHSPLCPPHLKPVHLCAGAWLHLNPPPPDRLPAQGALLWQQYMPHS